MLLADQPTSASRRTAGKQLHSTESLCVNGFVDPARVGIGRIIYNPHQERKEPIHVYRCVCGEGLDGA